MASFGADAFRTIFITFSDPVIEPSAMTGPDPATIVNQ